MAGEKKAVDLGLLEEDDEFEEFPTEGKTMSRKFVLIGSTMQTYCL
jgi:hypothetical protein